MSKKETKNETKIEAAEVVMKATIQLLEMAFDMWLKKYFEPLFYRMTRTFTHFRAGEKYDTNIIFEQLMNMNKGEHEQLLSDLTAYRKMLFDDIPKKIERMKVADGTKSA
jgi:hypothetical protein